MQRQPLAMRFYPASTLVSRFEMRAPDEARIFTCFMRQCDDGQAFVVKAYHRDGTVHIFGAPDEIMEDCVTDIEEAFPNAVVVRFDD